MRASGGFLALCWGLPLTLVLFMRPGLIALSWRGWLVPSYALGTLLALYGAWSLYRSGGNDTRWRSWGRQLLAACALQLYFLPWATWWRRQPFDPYLFMNMMALACSYLWSLLLCARLAETLAERLGERVMRIEAELCGWCTLLLAVLPLLGLFLAALSSALRHGTPVPAEMHHVARMLPAWVQLAPLVPLSLTVNLCWKARRKLMS